GAATRVRARALAARRRADSVMGGSGTQKEPEPRPQASEGEATDARVLSAGRQAELFALDVGLHRALQLDRQGLAAAVDAVADGQPDPAFGDAVFLDIGLVLALEADADSFRQQVGVVERAVGIDGQAVGKGVGHGKGSAKL